MSPTTDLCPNIEDVQISIPSGITFDAAGNCDQCIDLDGIQASVPNGYSRNAESWKCSPFEEPPPSPPPPTPPPPKPPEIPFLLMGAGDIGVCGSDVPGKTANLLNGADIVFTAGDNVQDRGTESEYQNCYMPGWGRYLSITRPSPGNHDFATNRTNYFNFFGGNAGPYGLGFYSYDLGEWHVISLNSAANSAELGAELTWLRADLSTNNKKCTAAYWHHPRFSSGQSSPNNDVRAFWNLLYEFGAEIVMNGHHHFYERFSPQDPNGRQDLNGIQEFIVGTGGYSLYDFGNTPNSAFKAKAHGVLRLKLYSDRYSWDFVSLNGILDSGEGRCR